MEIGEDIIVVVSQKETNQWGGRETLIPKKNSIEVKLGKREGEFQGFMRSGKKRQGLEEQGVTTSSWLQKGVCERERRRKVGVGVTWERVMCDISM